MRQATTQQTAPSDRAMGFEPVEGGGETTNAGTMLVIAYVVMWAILIGFIFLSWRRLGRVESRIQGLERALEAGSSPEK